MRVMIVDTKVAAVGAGCSVGLVQKLVRQGRISNHGTARRVQVDLAECDEVVAQLKKKDPRIGGNRSGARTTIKEST